MTRVKKVDLHLVYSLPTLTVNNLSMKRCFVQQQHTGGIDTCGLSITAIWLREGLDSTMVLVM